MKKAISIFRIAILALMGSVGVLFLLGEEQDETVLSFFLHFLFDKVFGLAMLAAMCVCSFGVGARPTTGSKPLMNGAKR